ncbi:PREDICTED: uncharacterized protein LOC104816005 [Tarenaya hassleriana]|uniref:uncharacterized protein LOC104816005 n=1 Tax=Tarenaya hassleriana TaxID=28532 RepID=UPI00053C08E3|nr:PREDICTED: uncharacterized protein LOC104816005 [Tarenaya hassleriana]XP_010542961.1 PREDICTED: uncharacterized protein LOC104816005 [Tarenaya hassleriana]
MLQQSASFNGNDGSNTTTPGGNDNNNADLSIILDLQEDLDSDIDLSSFLQFPVSDHLIRASCQEQLDFFTGSVQQALNNILYSPTGDPLALAAASSSAPPPSQSAGFEEDCVSSVASYNVGLNPSAPSCSFSGMPPYLPSLSSESSELFSRIFHLQPHDPLMDYRSDNGGISPLDSIKHIFNPRDLQMSTFDKPAKPSNEFPGLGSGPPFATEISGLDDSMFNKVEKLSVEQRKEKIHRYMKKRSERNFSKKIKYACRKTLADSRPRVRGRFAKNDERREIRRQASSSDDDDVGVKEVENKIVDSSDTFSHMNCLNSFNCNHPIQFWT